jgi:hypothetical protein
LIFINQPYQSKGVNPARYLTKILILSKYRLPLDENDDSISKGIYRYFHFFGVPHDFFAIFAPRFLAAGCTWQRMLESLIKKISYEFAT